ncbi:MAG: hypothetical protein ACP5FL_03925, partial [Thermoplasmatota archaeon]
YIPKITYKIEANTLALAEGATEPGYVVKARSDKTIVTDMVLDNGMLDEWWVSHVRNGERTTFTATIGAEVQIEGQGLFDVELAEAETTVTSDVLAGLA